MSKECPEVREQLGAYSDQELEPQNHSWIEDHLKICPPCQKVFKLIVGVKNRLKHSIRTPEVPSDLRLKVLKALDQEVAQLQPRRTWQSYFNWIPAPALVAVVILVLFFSISGDRTVSAHDFTEISKLALQRLENNELMPEMPDSPHYQQVLQESGLSSHPMPSLASMDYQAEGCCFGLQIGRPVAHYLYQSDQGDKVSVIMWKGDQSQDRIQGESKAYAGNEYYCRESFRSEYDPLGK